jgi:hypothetical protein
MRCPKCGYISFDHLEVCVKCKKNIKAVSDSLHGSVFQASAPAFLLLQPRQAEDEQVDVFGIPSDAIEEYVDDDLEILIEDTPEQDPDVEFADDARTSESKAETGKNKAADHEEEDGEIEIDFSRFEDALDDDMALADKGEKHEQEEERSFTMEMPAALADISDLAPPAKTAAGRGAAPVAAKENSGDLNMDDLDFNLGFDDLESDLPPAPEPAKETMLSLDDIDFSETLAKSAPKASSFSGTTDMDEELNFDLDLGGLSIHKDQ